MDKKTFSNFFYNTLYQLLIIALPIITTPFLARVLGVEALGTSSYVLTVGSFFIVFGMLGINLYGSKEIAAVRDDKEKLSSVFITIYLIQIVAHIFLLIIYFNLIEFSVIDPEYKNLFMIQSILIISSAFNLSWFLKGVEDFKKLAIRNFIVKIISVVLIFTFVRKPEDLWIYILINAASTFFGNLVFIKIIFQYIDYKLFKIEKFKSHFKNVILLFLPVFFHQVYSAGDRILLESFSSLTELGYYDQASKLIRIGLTLVTSLNVVMLPRIANMYANKNNNKIQNTVHQTMLITLFIGCFVTFAIAGTASALVPWFFGTEFISIVPLIMLTSLIIIFNSIGSVLTLQLGLASNNMKQYILPYIFGAFISVVLNIILIPKLGALGAVIALLCTEFIVMLIRIFYSSKKVSLIVVFGGCYKYLMSGISVFILIIIISEVLIGINNLIVNILQVLIGGGFYLLILILLKDKVTLNMIEKLKSSIK